MRYPPVVIAVAVGLLVTGSILQAQTDVNVDSASSWRSTDTSTVTSTVTPPDDALPPMPRTQDFESGAVQLNQVDSRMLESFLRDLNHRKDFDFNCHGGQAGPDGQYLAQWVQRVTDELCNRGYYVDTEGNLHRPGVVVSVR